MKIKYPNHPITPAQITKIHTLKSKLFLSDDNYEALLLRFGVESSKELTRGQAAELIDTLLSQIKGSIKEDTKEANQLTQPYKKGSVYFNRTGKATDNQINYIASLWLNVSDKKTYQSLMWFVKRITGKLYIHIESLTQAETRKVINGLKNWGIAKETQTQR
jgi:hypothetical protein